MTSFRDSLIQWPAEGGDDHGHAESQKITLKLDDFSYCKATNICCLNVHDYLPNFLCDFPVVARFGKWRHHQFWLGVRHTAGVQVPDIEKCEKYGHSNTWKLVLTKNEFRKIQSLIDLCQILQFNWLFDASLASRLLSRCGNRGCALSQPHTCACKMCIVINWQFRRTDHNGSHKPAVLFLQSLYI